MKIKIIFEQILNYYVTNKKQIMRKFWILTLIIAFAFLFNACDKSSDDIITDEEVEEIVDDEDDNDELEAPVITGMYGTTEPMQGRYFEYEVAGGEGSSFTWSTEGSAIIVTHPELGANAKKTYIYFPDAITETDDPDYIYVIETNTDGLQSEKFSSNAINIISEFDAVGILGSETANVGVTSNFAANVSELDKIYSTYAWECTGGIVTVNTETWKSDINFSSDDVGIQTITMTETTDKGLTGVTTFDVSVNCALENFTNDLVGTWNGVDAATPYTSGTSEIVTTSSYSGQLLISNINADWILNFWGEEVISGGTISASVYLDGTIVISDQFLFTTLYEGESYDYRIEGSGTWNNCGEYPTISLAYFMTSNGTEWGAWCYENGYFAQPWFAIEITLDPAGKLIKSETNIKFDLSQKPVH